MSLRQIFAKARQAAPYLLLFEDIDSLVTEEVRSYFFNEVDGLEDNGGILMIGSTNSRKSSLLPRAIHLSVLWPAMSLVS